MAELQGRIEAVPKRMGHHRPEFKQASLTHRGATLAMVSAMSSGGIDPPAGEPVAIFADTRWTLQKPTSQAHDLRFLIGNQIQTVFDSRFSAHNRISTWRDLQLFVANQKTFSADSELHIGEPTNLLEADLALTIRPPRVLLADTHFQIGQNLMGAFDTRQHIEQHVETQTDSLVEIGAFTSTHFDIVHTLFHIQLREEHSIAT